MDGTPAMEGEQHADMLFCFLFFLFFSLLICLLDNYE